VAYHSLRANIPFCTVELLNICSLAQNYRPDGKKLWWQLAFHVVCHAQQKSRSRNFLVDTAGISISASKEIFLARDCPDN